MSSADLDFRDNAPKRATSTLPKAKQAGEIFATLTNAARLLRDPNLVWSDDFNLIRTDLAELLDYSAILPAYQLPQLNRIAKKLMEEN